MLSTESAVEPDLFLSHFQCSIAYSYYPRGGVLATLALASGYHLPRLRRSQPQDSRAYGAHHLQDSRVCGAHNLQDSRACGVHLQATGSTMPNTASDATGGIHQPHKPNPSSSPNLT